MFPSFGMKYMQEVDREIKVISKKLSHRSLYRLIKEMMIFQISNIVYVFHFIDYYQQYLVISI